MSLYNFETVNYDKKYPANVFATYIGYSKFHCHCEYELCLVLKGKIKITYDSHTFLDSVCDELPPQKKYSYFVLLAAKIAYESLSEDKNSYFRGGYEIYHLISDLIEYVEYDIRSNTQLVDEDMKFF